MNASSLPALIVQRAAANPAVTILRRKDRGIWKSVTWTDLLARVRPLGAALLDFGIGRGDTAAILSETRPESVYADLAIQGTGAASIAIHPGDDAVRLEHILHATGCRLAFVEGEEQLDKVLSVRDRCPALSRIVIFDMKGLREFSDPRCVSLADFVQGRDDAAGWDEAAAAVTPDQPAMILFPRDVSHSLGRTLSHRDVTQMIAAARDRLAIRAGDERLAVLAMADVTERVYGLYSALESGCISNYLESPDTAAENLQELQPTVLGADADAWAHLHDRAGRLAGSATFVQRRAYAWAVRAGQSGGASAALANLLVLRAVRRELGLNRVRLAYVGGAPVAPSAVEWALGLGITIQHIDEPVLIGETAGPLYQGVMQDAHA